MLPEFKVPKNVKIAFFTDPHEHLQQFEELISKVQPGPEMWLVCGGDIYNKGFGVEAAEKITDRMKEFCSAGYGFVIRGNHELKTIRNLRQQHKTLSPQLEWLEQQPLAISFIFLNQTRLTVVHGGVLPSTKWEDLNVDVVTSYVREVTKDGQINKMVKKTYADGSKGMELEHKDGTSWHTLYSGQFGYIASGHENQADGIPKFYNYSCNMDSACFLTGILSCQIFDENGKCEMLQIKGKPARPERYR